MSNFPLGFCFLQQCCCYPHNGRLSGQDSGGWDRVVVIKEKYVPDFFFIDVQVELSPFSPHHSPPPQPSPPPTLDPTPLWLCPWVLYTCFLTNLPPFPSLSPPTSPLVTVSLFLISTSLVIFCLLFVLLIRIHLQVRSYRNFVLLPGLFYSA